MYLLMYVFPHSSNFDIIYKNLQNPIRKQKVDREEEEEDIQTQSRESQFFAKLTSVLNHGTPKLYYSLFIHF